MKLHEYPEEFRMLITLVSSYMHLPESAVERDYYIVMLLKNLADSEYAEQCVFKGGTSLSKCYPGSIERFSEDIDLTFLGMDKSDKVCDKTIKKIENIVTCSAKTKKIPEERSNRSKSMYVWFETEENKVKLEIGSSVRPDPFSKRELKTYIQEFLESHNGNDDIERFELESVSLNVLNIERTFIDKLMSVKRHAICGTLGNKVRHIYDVTKLYSLPEIQEFLLDKKELKRLIQVTKETDAYYLNKHKISAAYDPVGSYAFEDWQQYFTEEIKNTYENLHKELLYTDIQQHFEDALSVFQGINELLRGIGE